MSATTPTILEKPKIRSRSGGGGGSGGKGGGGGSQATVRLRAVVRHLPSLLKEDEFREIMADYVNEETTEWLSWIQGKIPAEFSFPSSLICKIRQPLTVLIIQSQQAPHFLPLPYKI